MDDCTQCVERKKPQAQQIDLASTSKLLKAALRARYPHAKFSVTSKTYAGGSSIHVSWDDGPAHWAVQRIAAGFAGAGFDSVSDAKTYHNSWLLPSGLAERVVNAAHKPCDGARLVEFAADYVMVHRDVSAEAFTSFKAAWGALTDPQRAELLLATEAWRAAMPTPQQFVYDETLSSFGEQAEEVFKALFRHCGIGAQGAIQFPPMKL